MWPEIQLGWEAFDPTILVAVVITVLLIAAVIILLIPWRRLSEALNRNGWYAWGTALLVLDALLYIVIQVASLKEATRLFFRVTYGGTIQAILLFLLIVGVACLIRGIPSRRPQFGGDRSI